MHALWLGLLVARNEGVSIAKIGVVKVRLPGSFVILLMFEKQRKPGESEKGTIRIDLLETAPLPGPQTFVLGPEHTQGQSPTS